MNIKTLSKALLETGGFTYSLSLGDLANSPFWAVGESKDTEQIFDTCPTADDIHDFMNKNSSRIYLGSYSYAVGGWEHKGKYYLDVARVISKEDPLNTLEGVMRYAKANDQIAIFDLETMTEIEVK